MIELGERDFIDVATGGTILGTGGGGSFTTAEHVAAQVLDGQPVSLARPDEVPDDARLVAVAGMGSPEAMLERPFSTEACHAFDALVERLQAKPDYVMPLETSGFNFLVAMTVAAGRDVPVLDADPAGRAIPKLDQTLLFARDMGLAPLAMANDDGKTIVVEAADYGLAERAALAALEYFGWSAGLACCPMNGADARRGTISGTISLAQEVGRAVRAATDEGADVLQAVFSAVSGHELIRGTISSFEAEVNGSYKFGLLQIQGEGEHAGTELRVKSMNENMLAWKDGRIVAVAPDRICFVGAHGTPVTNADIGIGDEVIAFVIEAQQAWHDQSASALFVPTLQAMGYEEGYRRTSELLHAISH